jgi:hypothetical protein
MNHEYFLQQPRAASNNQTDQREKFNRARKAVGCELHLQ